MTPVEIITAISAANQIIQSLTKVASEARRKGEWTPEQEAEFDAKLAEVSGPNKPAHWERS